MDEGSYNLNKTIDVLKQTNADIIFLQEVADTGSTKGTCKIKDNQSSVIPSMLGMTGFHYQRIFILVKPTIKIKSKSGAAFSNQDNNGADRVYQRAQLVLPDNHEIVVYNTHIERFHKTIRKEQITELYNKGVQENLPTIVGGDFNECSKDPVNIFSSGFIIGTDTTPSFTTLVPKNKKTWLDLQNSSGCTQVGSPTLDERIDYLFGSKNALTISDSSLITSAGSTSDHYPISSTFILTGIPVTPQKPKTNPNGNPATGASAWTAAKNIPLTNEELQKFLQKPTPRIKIPGLNFSDISVENLKSEGKDGVAYLGIPHLGEYVAALYKYLVVIAGIVSTVRLMIAGLQWALPDVSGERRSNAKKIMVSSVSGLIIAVTSYTILFTINPELVQFRNLHVLFIQPEGDGSAEHTAEKAATSGVKPSPCTGKKLPSQGIIGVADFARSEPYSCGNRDLSSVKYLVIHEGAIGDTTGVLTARGLSTHFVVQRDGKIAQNVDIRRRAAHAGSIANPWSVGIDLQIPKGCNQSGKCVNDKECSAICSYTPEQYESLNQIISILTQKTGIRKNDEHIIAHCQILYGNPSAGHGDPRNFDWKKIGLDPDKHRKNNNYVNGRCIKTYTVSTFDTLNQKSPKPKAVGAAGCCQIIENEQTKFINVPNNQCVAMKNSINWSEESCI